MGLVCVWIHSGSRSSRRHSVTTRTATATLHLKGEGSEPRELHCVTRQAAHLLTSCASPPPRAHRAPYGCPPVSASLPSVLCPILYCRLVCPSAFVLPPTSLRRLCERPVPLGQPGVLVVMAVAEWGALPVLCPCVMSRVSSFIRLCCGLLRCVRSAVLLFVPLGTGAVSVVVVF